MSPIYLDYAAATPIDAKVLASMEPFLSAQFYNPSATYLAARQTREQLESARSRVAKVLGARAAEVLFTAGGTEANNLAIHGVMRTYPGKKIIVGATEHESVFAPAQAYRSAESPVRGDGRINIEALSRLIDDDTVLISVSYANNEVGTVQPIREIGRIVTDVRKQRRGGLPLLLHSDATQAANYLDLHVARLGADLMTLNGGKIYGPKQTGALWVRGGVELTPLVDGGGQERGLRSGTENVASAVGFSMALMIAQELRSSEVRRLQALQKLFQSLVNEKLPLAVFNGSFTWRLPNNLHLTLPGTDNERILMQLDEAGIMAAAGSACFASKDKPSTVLKAMGISDADAQSSLRFTMGRGTDETDIRRTVDVLTDIVRQAKQR